VPSGSNLESPAQDDVLRPHSGHGGATSLDEWIEARRFEKVGRPYYDRAAALRRLRVRAAGSRDGQEHRNERGSER
jgi:hypothetical protein